MSGEGRAPLRPLPPDAPQSGTVWRHYGGARYQVIGTGWHTETLEHLVVYVQTNDEARPRRVWVRPLAMWHETVASGQPRFTRVR